MSHLIPHFSLLLPCCASCALRRQRRENGLPKVANFYYEPRLSYPDYTQNAALAQHVDFTIAPEQSADVPVSMICPWGKPPSQYLAPPPPKRADRSIVFLNEHGVAHEYR
jgi:hypothetical protein